VAFNHASPWASQILESAPLQLSRTKISSLKTVEDRTMKIRTLCLVIAASLLTACGGASTGSSGSLVESNGPAKLTATFPTYVNGAWKDVTQELVVTQGSVQVLEITPKTGSSLKVVDYKIVSSNYETDPLKFEFPKKEGDIKVTINVVGDKDATLTTPLKAGTYEASQLSDGENLFGKTWHILIQYFEGGKIQSAEIGADYPKGTRKGFVKINSVSADKLTGEIDLAMSEKGSVKGTFFAKLPQIKGY
jgi:hypothetical protein